MVAPNDEHKLNMLDDEIADVRQDFDRARALDPALQNRIEKIKLKARSNGVDFAAKWKAAVRASA